VNTKLLVSLALTALAGSAGCSTTIRSMTATSWIAPPGGAAAAPAAPPTEPVAEGAPTTTTAPAAATPGGIASHYYVTYWEGTCSGFSGCSRGDTHVKHCKANADNTLTCNDEAVATKALNP
jgi:hypothetical protein